MGEFIIIFYEPDALFEPYELYNIFSSNEVKLFLNNEIELCVFKILSNEDRLSMLESIDQEQFRQKIELYKVAFMQEWNSISKKPFVIQDFMRWFYLFLNDDKVSLYEKYSSRNIIESMRKYIETHK